MQIALPAELDTLPQSEAGVTFPLFHPATLEPVQMDGIPLTVTVKGSDSEAWALAGLEIERRNRKKSAAGEKIDSIADLCEQLAAVTIAWSGFRTLDKKEAQCTKEQVAAVYRAAPAIRDQVYVRVTRRENFIKDSPNA